jgi:alcohol dehydrogenase class IV
VVRWNHTAAADLYRELGEGDLTDRLARLAETAGLPGRLRDLHIPADALAGLAEEAAEQWTGKFNPRPFGAAAALEIYQSAY